MNETMKSSNKIGLQIVNVIVGLISVFLIIGCISQLIRFILHFEIIALVKAFVIFLIGAPFLYMLSVKDHSVKVKAAYWGIIGALLMSALLLIDGGLKPEFGFFFLMGLLIFPFALNIKYGQDNKKESIVKTIPRVIIALLIGMDRATKIIAKDEYPIQENIASVIIPAPIEIKTQEIPAPTVISAFVENKVHDAPIAIPVSTTPQKHISVCVRCKEEISFNTFTEEFTCPKCGIRNVSAATWQKIQNPLSSLGIGYWVQLIIFVIILGWIVDFMVAVGI